MKTIRTRNADEAAYDAAKIILRLPDFGVEIWWGMSKAKARDLLKQAGWSDKKIWAYENK